MERDGLGLSLIVIAQCSDTGVLNILGNSNKKPKRVALDLSL